MARIKPYDLTPLTPQVADVTRAGLVVRIKSERGEYRVIAEVLAESGAQWVELHGGPAGKVRFRFIHPNNITWPKTKRAKKEQS